MARRLNRLVSTVLSAALVLCSMGLDAQQAFAQTVIGRAAPVSAAPQLGLGSLNAPLPSLAAPAMSLTAPSLSAPSLLSAPAPLAAPVAAAPAALKPATPAAAIAGKILAAAPALQAMAKSETGGSAAATAGRDLEDVLTGVATSRRAEFSDAVAAAPSALAPALSAPSAPDAPKPAVVPAAAPKAEAPKTVESSSSYSFHRLALKTIAAVTGAVFSLPQAGTTLSAKIIASAADKQLVVSDFDDTLAGYNAVLPQEKIDAIRAIRKAGKHFAVVSDRGDEKRAGSTQLTVFESMASLPADVTEGMYVAANSGGRLYQYQNGAPVKVWEAEALAAEKLEAVKEASAAAIARLSEAGVEQHPGDSLNPKESYNTYGYALMIKVGATPAQMKQVAGIMGEELAKRGIEVEVMGRLPKDPANPGYATFSIITKSPATAKIAEKLGLAASQALVIGDMMYVPRDAKKASWLTRLGLKLSGLPIGETGNETDRNMSKGLPGVLALGVGRKMDPRIPNGWNLSGHGPEVTQKVLESVASKPAAPASKSGDKTGTALQLGMIGLIVGLGALGWYAFVSALADIVRMGEEAVRNWHLSPFGQDAGFFLGATTLGMAGMMSAWRPSVLSDPNESYATALKQAREAAAKRGVPAERVEFVEATASMPIRDGAQWHYTFSVPGALIYVDFSTFLGNGQDSKTSVFEGAPARKGHPISAEGFKSFVALTPDAALALLKNEVPGFGSGVSVSLAARAAQDGNGSQVSYRFYDDAGSVGTVGAAGAFVRADKLSDKAKKASAPAAGLTHAVEPNELYALALEKISAKTGVSAAKIKFLSAVHQSRSFNGAWIGDEWRFHFGVGGLEYMVPARRTMVTETMMDAFEPELKGTVSDARLSEGVNASLFGMGVKAAPDAALQGLSGVTRVSLLPRVEPVSGDKELWYSFQDSRDELAAMNARTGEIRKTAPAPKDSALKSFLLWLGGVALVALIYGGFYWAASNAPAAAPQLPEGWNGPVPTIDEFFRGMGGVLGLGLLAGTLRGKKAKVSDDDIAAAAKSVASSKGGIWSHTEYNMAYYNTLERLKTRGATKAQLELFKKLCAEAPVIGGRFNPWSGD